ncbi:MAG: hypothetical protein A2504_15015 [Bdellovibrionales bacterium RIFOXYD12_FULL_39_22]|nr:MAG: hypothetical protein A2385_02445 [Bdellovibrionales bacterium RIFOXYB1_FULL_39_21]OFZ43106.1 MAG: hypothetical protein A2485_11590 [Bdellovibrionales bacterium RIFOXYC12_FULL_39_17]OFZ47844.1 MAG: hypothetical protein A2404_16230 [Bdellovibrionales bacterium RIFOXYC1_FULL_39_130]OFZ75624.1 MAG: hypothetical protein A2560_12730 [Bdellovibrionales bacterium RIFOXYD1_FULL_39_84]OFZ94114.1 MAG: hypothetical protein A2504_15015 [Bdellovibrionales bacterium RIFOXYD12_FULL_39_22]HLE11821.1 hy
MSDSVTYKYKQKFSRTVPLTILLTLLAVIYQRGTGPTYPQRFSYQDSGQKVKIKLLRSHGGTTNAPITIPAFNDEKKSAKIFFKRFPTNDAWSEQAFSYDAANKQFITQLPNQPPAGKLQYYIVFTNNDKAENFGSVDNPIFIRFKGDVPLSILIPHIVFMFLAMLFSTLTGFEAVYKAKSVRKLIWYTVSTLFLGGLVLGPIVQKYAFGEYWAGIPFGWDLTDNKVLISAIFWAIALFMNFRRTNNRSMIIAAVILLLIYTIPHSTMGSQFNYDKNKVETAR